MPIDVQAFPVTLLVEKKLMYSRKLFMNDIYKANIHCCKYLTNLCLYISIFHLYHCLQ